MRKRAHLHSVEIIIFYLFFLQTSSRFDYISTSRELKLAEGNEQEQTFAKVFIFIRFLSLLIILICIYSTLLSIKFIVLFFKDNRSWRLRLGQSKIVRNRKEPPRGPFVFLSSSGLMRTYLTLKIKLGVTYCHRITVHMQDNPLSFEVTRTSFQSNLNRIRVSLIKLTSLNLVII